MLRSETAASPGRATAALAGLAAYQRAPRELPPPPMPARHAAGRARLRHYGGDGRPVVFVPSLINPPAILDLPGASLLRWVAARGFSTWLVDWGEPGEADSGLSITDHVEWLLLPLIEALDEAPVLVGYCLGGTIALAAAAASARAAGLATIAAPWRFAGYGEAREAMLRLWRAAEPVGRMLGVVPMEVFQAGFWQLDPARTIGKYEAFGRMVPDGEPARAFVRLEDWANAGAPIPHAAARQLFEEFVGADRPGNRDWTVTGRAVDPCALACPALEIVSRTDRIVPAATAAGLAERRDLAMGHVGMVVGSRARTALWEPLADWIGALPRRG